MQFLLLDLTMNDIRVIAWTSPTSPN